MNLEMDPCLLEQLDEQLDRGEYNSGALCSYGCPAGSVLFFAEATYHAGQDYSQIRPPELLISVAPHVVLVGVSMRT